MVALRRYEILLTDGLVEIDGADAYGPDGQMTTFYRCRDGREIIDVWATRISSFRTADILRIRRVESPAAARVA